MAVVGNEKLGWKDAYLVGYNALCCVGWALVWRTTVLSLAGSRGVGSGGGTRMSLPEALGSVYGGADGERRQFDFGDLLFVTQMIAVMEIVHAAVGLVRSPVVVTAMQVASRVVAVLALRFSRDAQGEVLFALRLETPLLSVRASWSPAANYKANIPFLIDSRSCSL